jgi:hypothetical protein
MTWFSCCTVVNPNPISHRDGGAGEDETVEASRSVLQEIFDAR